MASVDGPTFRYETRPSDLLPREMAVNIFNTLMEDLKGLHVEVSSSDVMDRAVQLTKRLMAEFPTG